MKKILVFVLGIASLFIIFCTNTFAVNNQLFLCMKANSSMAYRAINDELLDYVQKRAPELVKDDKIYLGRLDNSRLLEWRNSNVQSFIRNLLRYAVLRDGFRAEYKKSK